MRETPGQSAARMRRRIPPRSSPGSRGKTWFASYEIDKASAMGDLCPEAASFHNFTQTMGWSLPDHEGTLWCWVVWRGRRQKLWHLERCRQLLMKAGGRCAVADMEPIADPAWRTIPELASLEVPALTKSPPSIRARLKSLGLLSKRAEGGAWRYQVRGDAIQPKKEVSLRRLIARLRRAWRHLPAPTDAQAAHRRESLAILEWALQGGGLRFR